MSRSCKIRQMAASGIIILMMMIPTFANAKSYQAYGRVNMYVDVENGNARYWSSVIKIKDKSDNHYLKCFPDSPDFIWGFIFNDYDLSSIRIDEPPGYTDIIWIDKSPDAAGYEWVLIRTLNLVHKIGRWLQSKGHDVELYFYPISPIDMLMTQHTIPDVRVSTPGFDAVRQNKLDANINLLGQDCGSSDPLGECTISTTSSTCTGGNWKPPASGDGDQTLTIQDSIGSTVLSVSETKLGCWQATVQKGVYEIRQYYPQQSDPLTTMFHFIYFNCPAAPDSPPSCTPYIRTLNQSVEPTNNWNIVGVFEATQTINTIDICGTKQTADTKRILFDAVKIIKLR